MKNIRNILAIILVFFVIGCEKDFLDINTDPNVPFEPNIPHLLTSAQIALATSHTSGNFLGSALNVYAHQITVREQPDQYGMAASYVLIGNSWNQFYSSIVPNLDAIIEAGSEDERYEQYAAVATILKAFTYTQLVDIWGNVPFSEANQNMVGVIHPKLDNGAEIYNASFGMLDEALAMIDDEASILGDAIYGGSMASWARLANTLKLNLLNKTRKAKSDINDWQGKLTSVMNSSIGFINETEHFELFYTGSIAPDQRHPGFASGAYAGSQLSQYISPWIYEIMNGMVINATNNPFPGIVDPRVPFYWVRQIPSGGTPANPWEYKHGQFVSIFFGSIGPNRDMSMSDDAATVGLYPVGGRYDNGSGKTLNINDGTGIAPVKMLTYPDYQFMRAELALAEEGDPVKARDYLEAGITASLAHVDHVVNRSGVKDIQSDIPTLTGAHTGEDEFIDRILVRYDAATDRKLEIIMTQKWISAFYNGFLNFTDYRRTGYPVLFDPSGIAYSPNPYEDDEPIVPTQLIRSFPRSIWYPQREVELNPRIDQKPNLAEARVFWDK